VAKFMHESIVFCSACTMSSFVVKKVHVRYLISWWVSCNEMWLPYRII